MTNRQFYLKIILIAGLLLGLLEFCTQIGWARKTSEDPESTEVVVKLNPANATTIDAINSDYGTSTLEVLLGSQNIYRLQTPQGSDAATIADQMKDDLRLIYAEPNYLADTPEGDGRGSWDWGGPDATPLASQYAAALLELADAHSFSRGAGVVIAVVDTGLQLSHPTLAAHLTTSRYDFVDDDPVPEDEVNNQDDDGDGLTDEAWGHGTHVAGIVHLVAPEAQIMPLRVLDADGRGNIFVLAEALLYAAQNGADIINLSLGTSQRSELMKDVLDDMVNQYGVIMIGAAGNLNNNHKQYPAAEDEVLGVTATDANDAKSDFANFGDWIDIAAPGTSIYSLFPPDGHAWWSGTSMAVPFVSGQAALILGVAPATHPQNLAQHIRNTAVEIDPINPGFAGELGTGRIAVAASLRALCDDAGNCQGPTDPGDVIIEAYGQIESRPANGTIGTWVIGGMGYLVDAATELRTDQGPLVVGACVRVDYHAEESTGGQPYLAVRIRREEQAKCIDNNTPTPSSTTTATGTASPMITATPVPSGTATIAPKVTETTNTPTVTSTPNTMVSPTATPQLTVVVTASATPSATAMTSTRTPTATRTPMPTATTTRINTLTATSTSNTMASPTATPQLTVVVTASATPSTTEMMSTSTSTATRTPMSTATFAVSVSATATATSTVAQTPIPTTTMTATPILTSTPEVTQTRGQIHTSPSVGALGIWTIGGIGYLVTADTILVGDLTEGMTVAVDSYTDSDATQIAVRIRAVEQAHSLFLPFTQR